MKTLRERLIETRKSKGLSQPELAKKAKISQSAIAAIETGRNKSSTYTPQIAEALGVDPIWLATGKGMPTKNDDKSNFITNKEVVLNNSDNDYAIIEPLNFNEILKDGGKDVDTSQFKPIEGYRNIYRQYIESRNLDEENLRIIEVDCDDMSPLIANESIIAIDVTQNEFKEGGVFLINRDDKIIIKRLKRDKDGSWLYSQDNKNIPGSEDIYGLPGDEILGRVVWFTSNSGLGL